MLNVLCYSAISRGFFNSEPAIDIYFSKQVLCENKYYNLKEVLFF